MTKRQYRWLLFLLGIAVNLLFAVLFSSPVAAYDPPTIMSISPASGSIAGGDSVTITGTGFDNGASVTIGGYGATSVTFINDTTIIAVAPPNLAQVADVVVTNLDAQTAVFARSYTYIRTVYSVASPTPSQGPLAGGTKVTLTGTDLQTQAAVSVKSVNGVSCGVVSGEVYCLGQNANGQLGNGTYASSTSPVKVGGLLAGKTATAVSVATNHACAIADGEAYCWGYNGSGQLGNNSVTQSNVPVKVTQAVGILAGRMVTSVAVGTGGTSCAIADGEAYCWGANNAGQLGNNSTTQSNVPVKVTQTSGLLLGKTVTIITAAASHTCAIASGEAYCWGTNGNGQLGNNSTTQSNVPVKVTQTSGLLLGKTVTAISAANAHTCAVADGEAYCWGYNANGQLGNSSGTQSLVPVKTTQAAGILAGKTVTAVSVGTNHSCAIASGEVYCWGVNSAGQLGNGTTSQSLVPVKTTQAAGILAGKTATSLSTGLSSSCAVAGGIAYCWGANSSGQLGDGTLTNRSDPVRSSVGMLGPDQVFVGGTAAIMLKGASPTGFSFSTPAHGAGQVDVTLSGKYYQTQTLTNAYEYREAPTISLVSPGSLIKAGGDSVTITGSYFDASATVRFGDFAAQSVSHISDTTLIAIAPPNFAGPRDVIVTNSDGQTATAKNGVMYAAPAPSISSLSPAAGSISGNSTVTVSGSGLTTTVPVNDFSVTTAANCSVLAGEAYCWGSNNVGQLGNGTNTDATVRTKVKQEAGVLLGKAVTSIGNGSTFSCAIADAEAYCWGQNGFGQLGNGTTTSSLVPVKVGGSVAGKNVTAMAIGASHVCVVASGEVYCWGYNVNGQIGNGSTTQSASPIKVAGLLAGKTVSGVAAAGNNTCAIADGEAYCWGDNSNGQLGNGSVTQSLVPAQVAQQDGILMGKVITAMAASSTFSCAIADGEAYCWGQNNEGQLGNSSAPTQSNSPAKVTQSAGLLAGKIVTAIAAGSTHACAVASGELYCWGRNSSGQLGNGLTTQSTSPVKVVQATGVLAGKTATNIILGTLTSCTIIDSEVYCWGYNSSGQFGDGTTTNSSVPLKPVVNRIGIDTITFAGTAAAPTSITDTSAIVRTPSHGAGTVDVTVGGRFFQTASLSNAFEYRPAPQVSSISPSSGSASGGDSVTINGTNFDSNATVKFRDTPAAAVTFINSTTLQAITPANYPGTLDVTVVNEDNQSSTLKRTYYSQLPAPTITSVSPFGGSPEGNTTVTINGSGLSSYLPVDRATVGTNYSCFIADGQAYCAGINTNGQLGNGTTTQSTTPVKVTQAAGILADKTVTGISTGATHTCAIADGEAYCWGSGSSGQLGNGTTTQNTTPVKVTQAAGILAGKTVTAIAVGTSFSCAIASGEAYCWGIGGSGQLGNGSSSQSTTPVKVTQAAGILAGKTVTAIAVGSSHTCVVASGEAYCWGVNSYGQLGDGSLTASPTPVKVAQAANLLAYRTVTAVTAGASHTCAIADGEAYCWGIGSSGQLGNSASNQYVSPVKVTQAAGILAGKTVTSISAGDTHTCAIADGEAYCWGNNAQGQLGTGSGAINSPLKVTQAAGILAGKTVTGISTGNQSTCAIANNTAYCWGSNAYGQLADGSLTNSVAPLLTQAGFVGIDTVTFDGLTALITSIGPSAVVVKSPARAFGTVDIQLSGMYYQSALLTNAYTYAATPVLSSVSPNTGAIAGGETVTLSGSNFAAGAIVRMDGVAVSDSTVVNDTTITIKTPAGSASKVAIVVMNPDQQKTALIENYQYLDTAVAISSIAPTSGSVNGGNSVVVTGGGFTGTQIASDMATSTNSNNACAVLNGEAYCWGTNNYGQLGNGTTTQSLTPVKVTQAAGVLAGKQITATSVGTNYACAIADGEAYCWGDGANGRLGNGTTAQSASPVKVTQATGILAGKTVTSISAGGAHTCAIADGEAYCWGYNLYGQLGNNTTAQSTSPVKVTQAAGLLAGKTVTAISTGDNHTCAIANSEAYCWGNNGSGRLGNSSSTSVSAPVKVTQAAGILLEKTITDIVAGYATSCAVASGQAYCWGQGSNGEAGNGSAVSNNAPVPVDATGVLAGKNVTDISMGYMHACAVADNAIYCWGNNTQGQLGNGSTTSSLVPVTVSADTLLFDKPVAKVSASQFSTCVMATQKVYCWGSNGNGQLGNNSQAQSTVPVQTSLITANRSIGVTFGAVSAVVTAQNSSTITVTAPANSVGQKDVALTRQDDSTTATLANAYEYLAPPQITNVSPASGYKTGGDTVTITGSNFSSQATVKFNTASATNVVIVNSTTITATVPAGNIGKATVKVTNIDGQEAALTSGYQYGDLPIGLTTVSPVSGPSTGGTTVVISGSGFETVSQFTTLSSGPYHTCAVDAVYQAYCWGINDYGKLGDGTALTRTVPTRVPMVGALTGKQITAISAGSNHTCSVASGDVYCWGYNASGQLGNNSTTSSMTAVQVVNDGVLAGKSVAKLVTGDQHSCVLANGGVYCWGNNGAGQLGNNSTTQSTVPVAVTASGVLAGKTVTNISAGGNTTCAIANGATYCWGNNAYGQLGNNSTTASLVPIAVNTTGVLSGKTLTDISVGQTDTCGVAGGQTYCWGRNNYGQLGNNTNNQSLVPVAVNTAGALAGRAITALSVSLSTTCAIADGQAYCWGGSQSAQLGAGSTITSYVPITVSYDYVYRYDLAAYIGGQPASVTSRSASSIVVSSPAGSVGAKDVRVVRSYDGSETTLAGAYTYIAPPGVTAVTPQSGSMIGGDTVTITGSNFAVGATVMFGSNPATNVQYVSELELRVTVPAAASDGAVAVTVTNPDGQSGNVAGGYTYMPPVPSLTSATPQFGPVSGGTVITLTGANFLSATDPSVTFDGIPGTNVAVVDSTHVRATTPAHTTAAMVDIVYQDKYGQTATLSGALTYLPQSYAFTNSPLQLSASEPGKLTIVARDSSGQPIVVEDDVVLQVSSSSATGFFARDITSTETNPWQYDTVVIKAGSSSVDFYYKDNSKGTPTITVKDSSNTTATQVTTITSRYMFQVTGISDPLQAGVPSSVTVRAVNYAGQPETGYTGTLSFSSNDAAAVLPSQFTMTADMKGVHTFVNAVTLVTQGTRCVTVTDTSDAVITGSQCDIDVSPPGAGTPAKFAIITPEQHVSADGVSSAITIQAQDVDGLPAAVSQNTPVYVSVDSTTGQFSLSGTAGWSSAKPFVATIQAGTTAVNVYYRDSTLGDYQLLAADRVTDTASQDFGLTNAVQAIHAGVGQPTNFTVAGPSQLPINQQSTYTVTLTDSAGNPVTVLEDTTVHVDSANASLEIYAQQSDPSPATKPVLLTIPAGSSQVSFVVSSDTLGSATLSVSDSRGESDPASYQTASKTVEIVASDPSAIRLIPSGQVKAGLPAVFAVQLVDMYGNVTATPSSTSIDLSSSGVSGKFRLSSNGASVNKVTVLAGQSGASFYYYDTELGARSITATSAPLTTASADVTVISGDYSSISFTQSRTIPAGASEQFSFSLFDGYGHATTTDTDVHVTVSDDAIGGEFSLNNSTWTSTLTVTVPAGQSTGSFYYRNNKASSVELRLVDADRSFEIARNQTIIAAAPVVLHFNSEPQVIVKDTTSGAISIGFSDAYGNEAVADESSIISLTTDSATGQFSENGVDGWSSSITVTPPPGVLTQFLYYRDSSQGVWGLNASSPGYTGDVQTLETVGGFAQKTLLRIEAQTVEAGQPVSVSLETQTNDGLTVPVRADTIFSLNATSGEFSESATPFVPVTTTTLTRMTSTKTLFYRATTLGTKTLTAQATSIQSGSDSVQVAPSSIYKFATQPAAMNVPAATASSPFTVTTQDVYGNVSPPTAATTAYLYSSSGTGTFAANGNTTSSLSIVAGAASTSFTYRDDSFQSEPTVLTVSDKDQLDSPDTDIVNATSQVSIASQPVGAVVFTSQPQTLKAGHRSQKMTIALRQPGGQPAYQDGTTKLLLDGGNGGTFYASSSSDAAINEIVIPQGSATVDVYYEAIYSTQMTVTARFGQVVGDQYAVVQPDTAVSMKIVSQAQHQHADLPSDQIIVSYYDKYLNKATLETAQTMNLESTCPSGRFSESASDWQNTSAIQVPVGSDQLVFYYQSSVMGNCTLTVSNDALGSASQVFRVDHALAATISVNPVKPAILVSETANVSFTLKDIYGNVVPLTSSKTLYFSTNSSSGVLTPKTLTMLGGQTTASFTYADTVPGDVSLQIRDQLSTNDASGSLIDAEIALSVVQGDASKLDITPTSGSVKAGEYQAVTVIARNAFNAETAVVDDTAVQLESSGSGIFKLAANDDDAAIAQVTIPAGKSRATVYYRQIQSGSVTLTATDVANSLATGTEPLSVYGADIARIGFASSPRQLVTGEYGQVTLQLLDRFGNVTTTDAPLRVYLDTTTAGQFYASAYQTTPITSVVMATNMFAMTVYYRENQPAEGTISVRDEVTAGTDTGIANSSQSISVWYGDPVQVRLSMSSFSLVRGQVVGPIEVRLLNSAGTVIPAPTDTAVSVHDTANGLYATDINGTWSNNLDITIPANETSAALYYTNRTGAQASGYYLYAEAELEGATKQDVASFSLGYGAASQLSFVTAPQSFSAQHPSGQMTVELRNSYGAPVPSPADRQLYLRSSSATGEFSIANNAPWGTNYITLPKGADRVSFYYRDPTAGQSTITAADNLPISPDTSLLNAQQQATIQPQVFDHFYVANISDPQTAGTPSSVVVIAQDAAGYTIESYAGTVQLSSSDGTAVLPGAYTYRPAIDRGSKTFTNAIAFRSAGEKSVTATDQDGKSGTQTDITVLGANTNPVQAVDIIEPASPHSLARNQASSPITIQLKDASGIATTSGAGGYPIRLTGTSPTGELATDPNGPWQPYSMTATIPAGLSSLNVYYRDSQLGSYQVIVSDWIDGQDNQVISNDNLELTIDELTISTTSNIWSNSALGGEQMGRYLFAHDGDGTIAGRAITAFTSTNARDGSNYLSNWRLQWRQGGTLLDQITEQQQTILSYNINSVIARAGDADHTVDVTATDSKGGSKQQAVTIPISPWSVEATAGSVGSVTDSIAVTANIKRQGDSDQLSAARFKLYRAGDYSRVVATITDNVSNGGSVQRYFAPKAVLAGNYYLLVQLMDASGNTLAEDLSPQFSVGPEDTTTAPLPPQPENPSRQEDPVLPVVSTNTPDGLAVNDLTQIGSGTSLRPGASSRPRTNVVSGQSDTAASVLRAVQRTAVQIAASPYTPIVVPLLFMVGLAGFALTILLQIVRQIEYSAQLRRIARKERQTAQDKTQFVNLIAHHLRTPVTIITGALELIAIKAEGRELLASLQPKTAALTQMANELVTSINRQVNIPEANAVETQSVKIYQLSSFWIAGVAGILSLVAVNLFVSTIGSQSLDVYTYIGQVSIVATALSFLYFILQERANKKDLIARMTTAMYHRDELDGAKNHAIRMVANLLGDKLAEVKASARVIVENDIPGSKQLANGLQQLEKVVFAMNTLSSIEVANIKSETVDIQSVVVGELVERLQSLDAKHVKINEELEATELTTDNQLFRVVTDSLLDNAVAFSPDGGEISVKSLETPESTQIIIDDMGPGLPQAVTADTLQPFTHPGDEMTETHQGLGLSLYLNQLIMRHLGGKIFFEESLSGGAQVRLVVPKATAGPGEIPV